MLTSDIYGLLHLLELELSLALWLSLLSTRRSSETSHAKRWDVSLYALALSLGAHIWQHPIRSIVLQSIRSRWALFQQRFFNHRWSHSQLARWRFLWRRPFLERSNLLRFSFCILYALLDVVPEFFALLGYLFIHFLEMWLRFWLFSLILR